MWPEIRAAWWRVNGLTIALDVYTSRPRDQIRTLSGLAVALREEVDQFCCLVEARDPLARKGTDEDKPAGDLT